MLEVDNNMQLRRYVNLLSLSENCRNAMGNKEISVILLLFCIAQTIIL